MSTVVSTVDSAAGIRALAQALPRAFLSNRWSYLNMGFDPLQLRRIVLQEPSLKESPWASKPLVLRLCLFAIIAYYYMEKGLAVAAISSYPESTHPQDEAQFMAEEAILFKYPLPLSA